MIKGKKSLNPLNDTGFEIGGILCRWCEDPAAIGLRRVGFADEVSQSIEHRGWFLDDDFQDETARGTVYQLPTRKGRERFIAGMADPFNDGPAVLCLGTIEDDKCDAARSADWLAERYAEDERDYRRASSARVEFDELGAEVAKARAAILQTCADLRRTRLAYISGMTADRVAGEALERLCDTIRGRVSDLLDTIREKRKKRADLAGNYSRDKGWTDNDQGECYTPAPAG